jgi:diaminopimelate epimerase
MGAPEFSPGLVPVSLVPDNGRYFLPDVDGGIQFGAVSMGNPHAVIPTADLEQADVAAVGAAISVHPAFPAGCNVGFVQLIDRGNIHLRVYERGSAETLACGSGACAAMAVLYTRQETDSKVSVIQTGGELIIDWKGGNEPLYMTGPAVHVFEGIL